MPAHDISFVIAELATRLGGELRGNGDVVIRGINSLGDARSDEITFIHEVRYATKFSSSKAGAALVSQGASSPELESAGRPLIIVPDAELASIEVLEMFRPPEPMPELGVHPSAWVHPEAVLGAEVRIGPFVSVEQGAQIGDSVTLHAGVRIYPEAIVGRDSVLHCNCVIRERCQIGQRVILHQGVSIGADGFGYRPDPQGRGLVKVPHIGTVVIEDDVEIGANSCVDRGKFGPTRVGRGTKIDNLCQIGHNSQVGQNCVIVALTGIGGSCQIGDDVKIGGCVGVLDHVKVGDGASLGARAGVIQDVQAGEVHIGYPAAPRQKVLRQWAAMRKLPDLIQQLSRQRKAGE